MADLVERIAEKQKELCNDILRGNVGDEII